MITTDIASPTYSSLATDSRSQLDELLSIYKAYLDDLGRMGARQETLRQFYLSVVSALFVFLSLTSTTNALFTVQYPAQLLVAAVGMGFCGLWTIHMKSFAELFRCKMEILKSLETRLNEHPYTEEGRDLTAHHYVRLTRVDRYVAIVFLYLFIALAFFKVFTFWNRPA